ncbi:MAG: GHKL domain-containing protein [Clostridiales bacterium]|nr:GHKL domain-containing protein [Clostridiales bacterium]
MIRKLRMRLILLTMLAVLLVMVILIGGINVSNYRQVVSESDDILELLMRNGGTFEEHGRGKGPKEGLPPNPGMNGDDTQTDIETTIIVDDDFRSGKRSFMWLREDRIDSPELAYETRYFTVLFDESENAVLVDTGRISAVSESEAVDYAAKALNRKGSSGFIGDYRYLVGEPDENNCRMVIFRDCGIGLQNFRNFRNISIFVSLLCLIGVGILVFLASGRIVRPVAESYEKQKRFITDAGHEIKTPLAIITADAEVLEMEQSESEWISDIKVQTKRLSELTQDLISLSKMEETSTVLEMKDLDLSALLKSQTGSFGAVATASNKTISSNIEDGIHIQGDKKSIESLLSIVLDNAVKYCPENGHIDVTASRYKKGARIEVTNDTSETLSAEECKNMFERFYRTDASRNSETGGHGIGLSMAKAIVSKHKGRITAASGEVEKLTVTIQL